MTDSLSPGQSAVPAERNLPVANKTDTVALLLVFLLIAVSGMEYFYISHNYIFLSLLFASYVFFKRKKKIDKSALIILGIIFLTELIQILVFGGFSPVTFTGTYIRLILAYFIVVVAGKNFMSYYVRILFFFSVIALIFYAGSFLPSAQDIYVNVLAKLVPNPFVNTEGLDLSKPNVLVFNFERTLFSEHRNPGPFWEPGAFGVFVMIAMLFNRTLRKGIWNMQNIIFLLCLITTKSTMAYIAFFIFFIFYLLELFRKKRAYFFLLPVILYLTMKFYSDIPFLQEKILLNITNADKTTSSRFGSALADLETFRQSPFIGKGRFGAQHEFISDEDLTVEFARNNGIFILLATYGLPLTLLYFYSILKTFTSIRKKFNFSIYYVLGGFAIMMVLGFSQAIFLRPFFYSFLFLAPVVSPVLNLKKKNKSMLLAPAVNRDHTGKEMIE